MTAEAEHSLLSASSAPRWTRCYGSVALESTQPNEGSVYADEGTAAHTLGAWALESGKDCSHWLGEEITVKGGRSFTVDLDMVGFVQEYVDYVRGLGGVLLVETKVNYANWLGVPEPLAWGTSDAICVHDGEQCLFIDEQGYQCGEGPLPVETTRSGRLVMSVVDLKYGQGVAVYPNDNEQAKLYAGGSLNEIELLIEVRNEDIVRIVIHQPRIGEGEALEWHTTVGELKAWLRGEAATAAAHAVKLYERVCESLGPHNEPIGVAVEIAANDLTPGEKQCKFCNAKAICPALGKYVIDTVANSFVDLDAEDKPLAKVLSAKIVAADQLSHTELAEKIAAIPLIETTIKAWQARAETLLLAGDTVPGLKLVRGKKGNRVWKDAAEAAKRLKRYLGAALAMKDPEPISPTEAEKRLKKAGQAKAYSVLEKDFITQAEGGIHVAPASDPRETYVPQDVAQAAFAPIEEGDDGDLSHLA